MSEVNRGVSVTSVVKTVARIKKRSDKSKEEECSSWAAKRA